MGSHCEPCGKKTHPTMAKAIAAALRSSTTLGQGLRPYRCPARNGWHLTKQPRRAAS